jgi:hypothetical protein
MIVATLLAVLSLTAAPPVRAVLTAPTHTPKVKVRWPYSVRVTQAGAPVAGRITVQIVDPLGGVHPVRFGLTTTSITRRPFRGTFSDFVIWPGSSRGIPLTFRAIVATAYGRRTLTYRVTPRA